MQLEGSDSTACLDTELPFLPTVGMHLSIPYVQPGEFGRLTLEVDKLDYSLGGDGLLHVFLKMPAGLLLTKEQLLGKWNGRDGDLQSLAKWQIVA